MDQQSQIVLAAVGGAVLAGIIAFVWSAVRAAKQAAKRRYNPQRESAREPEPKCNCKSGGGCECPPYSPSQCIAARISVPDRTPVAIFGVRADGEYDDGRPSQSQVQSIVDRAVKLRALQQDADLDALLASLGRKP